MASLAIQLRAVPFEQIMRGAADARWRGERLQAVFATLLLILDGPT